MLLNPPADRELAKRALGPTAMATTTILGAGGREGFVVGEKMVVVFPHLCGTGPAYGGKVAVGAPPASNPFYALLLAKETLATHLASDYLAHLEVLLAGDTAIDMGKLKALGGEKLRSMSLSGVVAAAGRPPDGGPLYHVADLTPSPATGAPPLRKEDGDGEGGKTTPEGDDFDGPEEEDSDGVGGKTIPSGDDFSGPEEEDSDGEGGKKRPPPLGAGEPEGAGAEP